MASVVTGALSSSGLPKGSGYTLGFGLMAVAMLLAAGAAFAIPSRARRRRAGPAFEHAELGNLAAGTLVGDGPE